MRGKPNTDQFKSHDLHQFLESGAADRAESPVPTQVVKVTSTIEATKPEPYLGPHGDFIFDFFDTFNFPRERFSSGTLGIVLGKA